MESFIQDEGGSFDEDIDYFSDFLLSGMLEDSNRSSGNKENKINNEKSDTKNSLDEEGEVLFSIFSRIGENGSLKPTQELHKESEAGSLEPDQEDFKESENGSLEPAQEDDKESEQVEDNIDISNYLQTVLNCENTENFDPLESVSVDKESDVSDIEKETKKRKFSHSFEGDNESFEYDQLYEDLSKALGEVDYDIVDTDLYQSYTKEENDAYDEHFVNVNCEKISEGENDVGSNTAPLKLRPIKDLLRADVSDPFTPRQKTKNTKSKKYESLQEFLIKTNHSQMESEYLSQLEPGQIRTPLENMNPSFQPQQPNLCQPNGKWQCWPSRLSQQSQENSSIPQQQWQQNNSMSPKLQTNTLVSPQMKANMPISSQLQPSPSIMRQQLPSQTVHRATFPTFPSTLSTVKPSQISQSMEETRLSLSAPNQSPRHQATLNSNQSPRHQATLNSNQSPRHQATLNSFFSPSLGNQPVLPPQRNQSVIASSGSPKVLSTSQKVKMISVQRNQPEDHPYSLQSVPPPSQRHHLLQSPLRRRQFVQSPSQTNRIHSPSQGNQFMQSPLQSNPNQPPSQTNRIHSPSQGNQFMQSPLQSNPNQPPSQTNPSVQSLSQRAPTPNHKYQSWRSCFLQSSQLPNIHSPARSPNTLGGTTPNSVRSLAPNTIHHRPQLQSTNTVHYKPQPGSVKSPTPARKVEFSKIFPKNALPPKNPPSKGANSPSQKASPKTAPVLQTYNDSRLPPGWYLTGVIRKSGVSKGKFDFYIHGMGKRFRSMPEIVRFYDLKRQTEEIEYIDYKGIEESIKTFRTQLTDQYKQEPEIGLSEPKVGLNEPKIDINEPKVGLNEPEIDLSELQTGHKD